MAKLDTSETIAAGAAPEGPAPRGIVRISGPRAHEIAFSDFLSDAPSPPETSAPARMLDGAYRLPELRVPLPARVFAGRGPRTYTGDDLCEVHLPGSPALLELFLERCFALGARHAEPGEFTLRAYLAGKLDLARAEGVAAVVQAEDSAELESALEQLAGGVSAKIRETIDRLLNLLAFMEAHLDFADEPDVIATGAETVAQGIDSELHRLDLALEKVELRGRAGSAPKVVLVGPPNAGKSSLFNALASGGRRAIVSDIPGTTRDALSARIDCGGVTVELYDTAGIEPARDSVALKAAAVRESAALAAELIIDCMSIDDSAPRPRLAGGADVLFVRTKADLASAAAESAGIATSAVTGQGLEELRSAIAAILSARTRESSSRSAISPRVAACLAEARSRLAAAARTGPQTPELAACDVRAAIDELGKVFGESATDDILDRIFSRFCIGK